MLTFGAPHRQTIRRLQSPLAQKVRRVPPQPPQECRIKRRHQRPGHGQPDRQAHPSQPGAQAAPPYLPRPRSCMSNHSCCSLPSLALGFTGTVLANGADLQINPYMSNPCHIELILTEGEEVVQKGPQVAEMEKKRLNSRQRGVRLRRAITQG